MNFKPGVKVFGVRPEIVIAMMVCARAYEKLGYEYTITSVCDGKHSKTSFHYNGLAFDIRIRHMLQKHVDQVFDEINKALTDEYDVVLEKTHIHIEFQPERRY